MALMQDDTQPRRPAGLPKQAPLPPLIPAEEPDMGGAGPGCLIWVVVLLFSGLLGLGVVGVAGLAGWTEGFRVAQGNATATRESDIRAQCERIPADIGAGSVGLAARRLEDLQQATPAVPCVAQYAPTLTAIAQQTSIALTPQITPTATPSPTATTDPAALITPTLAATPAATSSSGFDLGALLAEAQADMAASEYRKAVDTLDAISAIDPTYEKATVDSLIFSALTKEALRLFRSGENLAEAVLLTNRAEEYGDVGELNFERAIASLYVEAQGYRNTNPRLAISLLSQIVYQYALPNYMGGTAFAQLVEQYGAYGDLLLPSAPCEAVTQYDLGLAARNDPNVAAKRAQAQAACSGAQTLLTPVAGATAGVPTPAGFVPIGQQ